MLSTALLLCQSHVVNGVKIKRVFNVSKELFYLFRLRNCFVVTKDIARRIFMILENKCGGKRETEWGGRAQRVGQLAKFAVTFRNLTTLYLVSALLVVI